MGKIADLIFDKIFGTIQSRRAEILLPAMNELLADMTTRIFQQGRDSKNAKIGEYSKRPYVQEIPIPQVSNGKLKSLARKQGRKDTVYVEGGYSQVRELTGRQNKFVDLNFTGSLFLSIKIVQTSGGFALAIVGRAEIEKAEKNEKKYGKEIFKPTKDELEKFRKAIIKGIEKELS